LGYTVTTTSGTLTVNKKALSITAGSASNKVYDGATSAIVTAGTLSGFIGTETVTATATGTFADKNVANGKTVTLAYTLVNGTNGGVASNYSLANTTTTANITAKALSITAGSATSKVYDSTTAATVTAGTLSGFIGSETVAATTCWYICG